MLTRDALGLDGAMLDEAKAFLRLECDEEDAPLGALVLAAIAQAEMFTGMMLIRRGVVERLNAATQWQRLGASPARSVMGLTGIPAEGAPFTLPVADYAVDIDNQGDGWVRVIQPGSAGRIEVAYQAGLAGEWAVLPETLRLGVLRMAGHLFTHRDAAQDIGPPPAVAALLRPWKRMRLT
jgi:uncharacterized phiE125 gp8 family phage protein